MNQSPNQLLPILGLELRNQPISLSTRPTVIMISILSALSTTYPHALLGVRRETPTRKQSSHRHVPPIPHRVRRFERVGFIVSSGISNYIRFHISHYT